MQLATLGTTDLVVFSPPSPAGLPTNNTTVRGRTSAETTTRRTANEKGAEKTHRCGVLHHKTTVTTTYHRRTAPATALHHTIVHRRRNRDRPTPKDAYRASPSPSAVAAGESDIARPPPSFFDRLRPPAFHISRQRLAFVTAKSLFQSFLLPAVISNNRRHLSTPSRLPHPLFRRLHQQAASQVRRLVPHGGPTAWFAIVVAMAVRMDGGNSRMVRVTGEGDLLRGGGGHSS